LGVLGLDATFLLEEYGEESISNKASRSICCARGRRLAYNYRDDKVFLEEVEQ
jgi:hypothetical protein